MRFIVASLFFAYTPALLAADFIENGAVYTETISVRQLETITTISRAAGFRVDEDTKETLKRGAQLLDTTETGQRVKAFVESVAGAVASKASEKLYELQGYERRETVTRQYSEGGWIHFLTCGLLGEPARHLESVEIAYILPASKRWLPGFLGGDKDKVVKFATITRLQHED